MAALVAPILQMALFGSVDLRVRNVPTVVVDQDRSSASRLFVDQLTATGVFNLRPLQNDVRAARGEIAAGRARVALIIPPAFGDDQGRGREGHVHVLIDGSDSTVGAQALAAVNGLAAERTLHALQASGEARSEDVPGAIAVHPVMLFNPEGRSANFLIPGLLAIILQLVAIVQAATSVVRERERGTLEQLLVTPIDPAGFIVGKLLPYLLLGLADSVLILAMMALFGVEIRGSVVLLLGSCVLYLSALLCLGLLVSIGSRTQQEAQDSAQLFFLPSFFLSGFMFPIEGLPVVLRWLGQLMPATHMIELMRGVILRNADATELAPHFAALLAITCVLALVAVRRAGRISVL